MHLDLAAPILALERGEVLTLDDARGVRIHARLGTLWVTEEGDVKDHIVGPGDVRVVASAGRTVVQALARSWVSIRESLEPANDSTQSAA